MIQVARRKALQAGCERQIEFCCLPMEQIDVMPAGEMFDGVLSNFGAVNCAQDLQAVVTNLARRLAPNAPLLWVVMGRHVPWEWVWYLLKGDVRRATRRLRPGGSEWRGLIIRYPTPSQLRALLQPYFKVTRIAPLGVVLPPSYAAGWLERSPRSLEILSRLERRAQSLSPLASLADHFIIEATRLPAS
jgi:hypothetical protein